jgi:hypothetical protein
VKAAQALAQWLGGVKTGQDALVEAERKLAAHIANPPTSPDAAEHRAWLATRRQLEDDVEAERGALAIAEAKAAEAKAAAAVEEADAEERRIRKLNDELAKLTVEIGGDAERLATKLQRHTSMLAEVDSWNASRGDRAFIQDGEAKVREVPAKDHPTVWEEVDVWRNVHGHTPSQFREVDGEMVPIEGGYEKRRERIVSRNAWSTPAFIPAGRYAAAMKIIGLKGELFPVR